MLCVTAAGLPEVIRAIPFCADDYLRGAARLALVASARQSDADLLRRTLKSKDVHTRRMATAALGAALGPDAVPDLLAMLGRAHDPDGLL